ncbi:hypothetical protein M0802_006507 [Mischocyttarus mexicanus]|nr:hypothetical protein M0802_006507 [Mischocyttarus mexicanus]
MCLRYCDTEVLQVLMILAEGKENPNTEIENPLEKEEKRISKREEEEEEEKEEEEDEEEEEDDDEEENSRTTLLRSNRRFLELENSSHSFFLLDSPNALEYFIPGLLNLAKELSHK